VAYDEELASRIRAALPVRDGWTERKMFGGIGFMLGGNMCVGVHRDSLLVRLDAETAVAALDEPGAKVFDLTGRAMTGWLTVDPTGTRDDGSLQGWVDRAVAYVSTMPPK
jgi:TfoX/Sxy family transcriptional regulator of competence genes